MTDDPLKPIAAAVSSALAAAEASADERAELGEDVATDLAASPDGQTKPPPAKRAARRKSSAMQGGGAASRVSDGETYDVAVLNKRYALVLFGSQAVIFIEEDGRVRFISIKGFEAWFKNRYVEIQAPDGKRKNVTWATAWQADPRRRQFRGVEFFPNPDGAAGKPGYLNLWRGFSVKPIAKPNGYKTFRDHLLTNVCQGDERHFKWLFGFFAHMIQRPRERIGVAFALRGKQGSGKTIVGLHFGSLLGAAYLLVDDPRYVTGNFNVHLAACLLLEADEACWAGDKSAEGRLKGLITSPVQQIEAKGVDPVPVDNYVRVIMTSNERWVVPAGPEERRFAVFDVDPRCVGNGGYFREMAEEMDKGGREALLFDLLSFDLDGVDLRTIPKTKALLDQKERSLDSVATWLLERLEAGRITRHANGWDIPVSRDELYTDYVESCDRVGVKRRKERTIFGRELRELLPYVRDTRPERVVTHSDGTTERRRERSYDLPPLAECRAAWDEMMQQARDWPSDDNFDTSAGERTGGGEF